jgi:hypothetical protein
LPGATDGRERLSRLFMKTIVALGERRKFLAVVL